MKNLSQKVVKLLRLKNIKISLAESCTGGLLASIITSISGASKIFTLGLVTYSNQSKIKILKVLRGKKAGGKLKKRGGKLTQQFWWLIVFTIICDFGKVFFMNTC